MRRSEAELLSAVPLLNKGVQNPVYDGDSTHNKMRGNLEDSNQNVGLGHRSSKGTFRSPVANLVSEDIVFGHLS